ncbi:securin NDAI_0J01350 [Naumovozyma dairenensis CBS 421]|uniref:Uncharacterized protein n=1 Tax=Naumovozyma dairenensis (strain ATCC 10597 / BCRC 20456 / CBS 421 / NBRC 0211 / NRRL Y-12639) TaxID=1071378 RepID=G0WGU9_NAUDC|nr:hypothetical protein NDAI_0J01350 [Naumovozyma dairenensis CBS 421]CCD27027.1 hypothetical protein NDAI_0J01350 [Naumovozyma dairenensis CBS 421]
MSSTNGNNKVNPDEDKENASTFYDHHQHFRSGKPILFPQTPAHLLKRSSSILSKQKPDIKPGNLELQLQSDAGAGAVPPNISPRRQLLQLQNRFPLSKKDNNNSFILKQQQQQFDHKRLKKYGSVLGLGTDGNNHNNLTRIKSLVLKDIDDDDNAGSHTDNSTNGNIRGSLNYSAIPNLDFNIDTIQERRKGSDDDSEDDDTGADDLFGLKLKHAMNNNNNNNNSDGSGLLFHDSNHGLHQLINFNKKNMPEKNSISQSVKLDNKKEDTYDEEDDIEYAPIREDSLPYIPQGYTPFTNEDINKLKVYHSPFAIHHDHSDYQQSPSTLGDPEMLLSLQSFDTQTATTSSSCASPSLYPTTPIHKDTNINTTDQKHNTVILNVHNNDNESEGEYGGEHDQEIDKIYNGDGLDEDDLNDLINDLQ